MSPMGRVQGARKGNNGGKAHLFPARLYKRGARHIIDLLRDKAFEIGQRIPTEWEPPMGLFIPGSLDRLPIFNVPCRLLLSPAN
ncbi:hypothetical protein GCM10011494_19260 [Novosphingobium endophyticum]|uniref:Uncharacterized protein n=1 Tax=Novosphingobium endophyticum TaxID=1955250 RepID=A0A916TSA8_9SPHN|nr:hypothetical protein GCM10011494_19260 [Novosphingobium endophyticum]